MGGSRPFSLAMLASGVVGMLWMGGGPSSLLVARRAFPVWPRAWGPGLPSWASRLSSFPPPWLLESAYSYLVPHAQMWACVPTQVGGWPCSGGKEGSQRAPGVSLGVRACGRAPLPLLAQLGWRGEGQVCWVPPHLQFGCPSSSLELGRSPLPAPE